MRRSAQACTFAALVALAAASLVGCETDPASTPSTSVDDDAFGADAADARATDARATDEGTPGGPDADARTGDAGPTPCRSDADCSGPRVCVVDRSGGDLRRVCREPNQGGGEVGDSCSKHSDCRANLCLEGTCTKPCSRPVHCKKSGWTCKSKKVSSNGGTKTINVCQPAPSKKCHSDGDCSGQDRCIARRGKKKVKFVCDSPNTGGATVGESCSKDGDCLHNLCLDGSCAPPCGADRHCSGASDHECKMTDIDLGNGNSDTASVCRPPRPCAESDQCRVNEVCYVQRSHNSSAGVCRPPNPGGGSLGTVCQGDGQCEANLCYDGRFRDFCAVPCKDKTDCSGAGYRCEKRAIADGSGGTRDVEICVQAAPKSCSKPSDCGSNRNCAIVVDKSGTGLESVCIPSSGGLGTGNQCNKDGDCNSQVCLNGHCSSPCVDRSHCASNQLCHTKTIRKSGQSGSFKVCETPAKEKCTQSGTCSDAVRICSNLQSTNMQLDAYCRFPNGGASSKLGDSCSKHSDCRTGLCLGDLGMNSTMIDQCSVACRKDSQCATGQICTSFPNNTTDVAICTKPCSTNADCSGSNTCQINENRMTSPYSVDTICRKPPGMKQFGETCGSSSGSCESGLCLTTYTFRPTHSNDQPCSIGSNSCPSGWGCHRDPNRGGYYCADEDLRCTRLCTNDPDCSGGVSGNPLTTCDSQIQTQLSDGTNATISACAQN